MVKPAVNSPEVFEMVAALVFVSLTVIWRDEAYNNWQEIFLVIDMLEICLGSPVINAVSL
jgi:hypothetical protein